MTGVQTCALPIYPFWSNIFISTIYHSLNIFSYFLCNSIVFSFVYKFFYKTNFLFFSLSIFFSTSRFFNSLTGTKKDAAIQLKKKDLIWPIMVVATDVGYCDNSFADIFDSKGNI